MYQILSQPVSVFFSVHGVYIFSPAALQARLTKLNQNRQHAPNRLQFENYVRNPGYNRP